MRLVSKAFSLTAMLIACKSKATDEKTAAKPVKVDRSTPADLGRSLCSIFETGEIGRLGEIYAWSDQVAECNSGQRTQECRKAGWRIGTPCTVVTDDKTYPNCTEAESQRSWREFASTFAAAKSTCTVERPNSGKSDEIDMIIFGTRETVFLEKQPDRMWRVSRRGFFLPGIQIAAFDARAKQVQDRESGFDQK